MTIQSALKRLVNRSGDGVASPYYDARAVSSGSRHGKHRDFIGGLWEEVGRWQFDLLTSVGLRPEHLLLDVGCGSFRGGVKFVDYLEPGNYFGFDLNAALIEAGYEREIARRGLAAKLPRKNLWATDNFTVRPDVVFDFALAVSVFTHLPMNHIRVALENVGARMKPGGVFLATYFACPEQGCFAADIRHEPGGIITHPTSDPYHYRIADFRHLASGLPWAVDSVERNDHPRGQRVIRLERL